jgi:CBS domain-containing protein
MTPNLVTLSPNQTLREVMKILLSYNVNSAPVVDQAMKLLGILSELDCLRVIASGSYDQAPYQMERTADGFMTTKVITAAPGEEVFRLVELFEKYTIRSIPVVDDGALIGQVTRRDVLRQLSLRY